MGIGLSEKENATGCRVKREHKVVSHIPCCSSLLLNNGNMGYLLNTRDLKFDYGTMKKTIHSDIQPRFYTSLTCAESGL